jgi:RHS repeat-associated protein
VVTDLAGDVVESTEFYPFGRPRHEHKNGFTADYQYTGKELDNETGLMYFEARYMDAVTGRFVSVDPLVVAPSSAALLNPQLIHPYAYAANNPIIYLDPDGLAVLPAIGRRGGVSDNRSLEKRNVHDPKAAKIALKAANSSLPSLVYVIAKFKGDGDAAAVAKRVVPAIREANNYVDDLNPYAARAEKAGKLAGHVSTAASTLGTAQTLSGIGVVSGVVTNGLAAGAKGAEAGLYATSAALTPTRPQSAFGRQGGKKQIRALHAQRVAQQVFPILSQAPGASYAAGEKFDKHRRGSIDRANIDYTNAAINASNSK